MLNINVVLSIYRQPWLVDAPTISLGQRILAGEKLDFEPKPDEYQIKLFHDDDDTSDSPTSRRIPGNVAVFRICGTLYKEDSFCSYGTSTIARKLQDLCTNEHISAVVLDIESGGGSADAVPPMLQALRDVKEAGKRVYVHTDYCCSAAYWIASAADRIYMDNDIVSVVGSIGAFAQVVETSPGDLEKNGYVVHTIYANESPDKNKAYRAIQQGDDKPYKDNLSRLVSNFHTSVKTNRPSIADTSDGVFTGDVFNTNQAIANGLADGVMTLSEVVAFASLASFH